MSSTPIEELGLPDAAGFVFDVDGEVHVVSAFGDTWCTDFYDEDADEFVSSPEIDGPASRPKTVEALCKNCVTAAKDDQ